MSAAGKEKKKEEVEDGKGRDKVEEQIAQAMSILFSAKELGRMDLWRAYVAVEYAILDLKMRHGIEGQAPPPKLAKKKKGKNAVTIEEEDDDALAVARAMLERIDLAADEKKLLYDLRSCRDVLKSLVAGYDRRRSTTS